MERQPLRLINLKATTYSARHIPHLGFGREEATAKHVGLQGCLITVIHLRKFKLSCGCTVKDADQCAGVCVECREELRHEHNILHSGEFTLDELDWLATPCRRHWFTCAYSFCSKGGCSKHLARAGDGDHYCEQHFVHVTSQLEIVVVEEKRGFLFAKVFGFVRSLFFHNPDVMR